MYSIKFSTLTCLFTLNSKRATFTSKFVHSWEFSFNMLDEFRIFIFFNQILNILVLTTFQFIYILDIPKLEDSVLSIQEEHVTSIPNLFKRTSGRRSIDPYTSDESRYLPFIVILALFIPILIFLCRL